MASVRERTIPTKMIQSIKMVPSGIKIGTEQPNIQWNLGSRTPLFTNKFSEQKKSRRMMNGVSDYEHASWQQRQAESIGAGMSVSG
jgi:hypothetical protein